MATTGLTNDNGVDDPYQDNETAENSAIDLREVFAAFYRSRKWIGAIFLGCLVIAFAYTLLATRLFDGIASIEVRQEAEKVLGTEADREGAATKIDSDRFLQTQLDIIRSRSVANSVAESLGLYRDSKFLDAMNVTDEPKNSGVLSPDEAKRQQVLETLEDNLSVFYTGETRLLAISFTSPDPRLASKLSNAFAESYIRNNLSRKFDSSSYALEFLRDQLTEAQARLEKSEQAAVDYASRTRIVDVSNAATGDSDVGIPKSLITAQLVQLNTAYSQAVADRIAAQEKWRRVSAMSIMTVPDVLSNQAVQALIERRAQAEASYEEQLTNRQPDYPTVKEAKNRVGELNEQIGAIGNNIRRSIRSEYDVALALERQIARRIDRLKTTTLSEQNESIELSILRREANTNRLQYESLLKRYNELNAEAGVQSNNLAIVDRAPVPVEASWPKWPLNIALAILFGGLVSTLFVVVREQLFDVVRTGEDVQSRLRLALLGGVPVSETLEEDMRDPKTSVSEAFSSIRTGVALASDHGIPRSIMFTSTQASEGKSSACFAMAMSFARLGKKVLVIDVDLRRPNAHHMFNVKNTKGASNVLAGQIDAKDAIIASGENLIDILPAGDIPPNPTELIMGNQLETLLDKVSELYEIVLVDSAPVLGLADAIILSRQVEATIFVIEAGRTSMKGAQGAVNRLSDGGGHVIGAILSKLDLGSLGYGGDYTYQYEYKAHNNVTK